MSFEDDVLIRFKRENNDYIDNNVERKYKEKDTALRMWFTQTHCLDWYRITPFTYTQRFGFYINLKNKHKWHYFKSLWFLWKNYRRIKAILKSNKPSPVWAFL